MMLLAMINLISNGDIIKAASKKLFTTNVANGEAQTPADCGVNSVLIIEGGAIYITLAIQQPSLFSFWNFSSIISDFKVTRSTNFNDK